LALLSECQSGQQFLPLLRSQFRQMLVHLAHVRCFFTHQLVRKVALTLCGYGYATFRATQSNISFEVSQALLK
jgi:hypothetical protein